MIKYPDKISKGKLIGVTATSSGLSTPMYEDRLDNAYKNLKELGYICVETDNVRTNYKFVSSDGKTRAKEFMELWVREDISWIAQAFGGEFLIEMLPFIDAKTIMKNNPKWVSGYSDSSLLNYFLTTNFNVATATSDSVISFGMDPLHKSLLGFIKILEECNESIQENFDLYEEEKIPRAYRTYNGTYNLNEKVEYKHLYNKTEDKITGRLIGGCIDCLVQLIGTPQDNTINFCKQFKKEGMLWYLENCELTLPALYRTLYQMKQAGWFNNTNGFIIGRTRAKEQVEDFEYLDVLHKIFDDMNVPVIYDIDTGHVSPQWTMINGSYSEFKYSNGAGKIFQSMI